MVVVVQLLITPVNITVAIQRGSAAQSVEIPFAGRGRKSGKQAEKAEQIFCFHQFYLTKKFFLSLGGHKA